MIRISGSSWSPLASAAALFTGAAAFLFGAYGLSAAALAVFIVLILRWLWTGSDREAPEVIAAGTEGEQALELPTQSASGQAPGWWATVIVVLISAALFASLVFAYFYLWLGASDWPPEGQAMLSPGRPLLALGLLLAGSAAVHSAVRANQRARPAAGCRRRIELAALLYAGFIVVQALVLADIAPPQSHTYASLVHVLVGFHGVHAVTALLFAVFAWLSLRAGSTSARRPLALRVTALFWHYTTTMWLFAFAVVHLFPRLQ